MDICPNRHAIDYPKHRHFHMLISIFSDWLCLFFMHFITLNHLQLIRFGIENSTKIYMKIRIEIVWSERQSLQTITLKFYFAKFCRIYIDDLIAFNTQTLFNVTFGIFFYF